jgi:hypothetical protein
MKLKYLLCVAAAFISGVSAFASPVDAASQSYCNNCTVTEMAWKSTGTTLHMTGAYARVNGPFQATARVRIKNSSGGIIISADGGTWTAVSLPDGANRRAECTFSHGLTDGDSLEMYCSYSFPSK